MPAGTMKPSNGFASLGQQLTAANQKEFFDNLEKDQTRIMEKGGFHLPLTSDQNKENIPMIAQSTCSSSGDSSSYTISTPIIDS